MTMRSWLRRLFARPVNRTIRKEPRRIRPALERLEDRLAPATVSDGGTGTLSIALAANENLAIVSNGASYTFSSNLNFTNGGVASAGDFSGFASTSLTLNASGIARYTTAISITDTSGASANDTATFNTSGANSYANHFVIALTSAAAGSISFNGTTSFSGANTLSASTTDFISVNSGATVQTNSGNLTLTAAGTVAGSYVGINVNNATVESTTGAITLSGTGGNTGSNNYGVEIQGGGVVTATGASPALLSITGTPGNGTSTGIDFNDPSVSNNTYSVSSAGNVSLTGSGGSIAPQFGGNGATINITSNGGLNAPTLAAGGTGYPANATVDLAITGGGGSGGIVAVTTNAQGVVTGVASVVAAGTNYSKMPAAATIEDVPGVKGATVTLTTTGSGNDIGIPPPVGGTSTPLLVNSTRLNATTSDGFIVVANITGNMALGTLNAGAALIELTAVGAITDANNGSGSPNLTAADGAVLTTTASSGAIDTSFSAIGTPQHPIRTAIGSLMATTYDGGVYVSDSNSPGIMIGSILAQQDGSPPILNGSNQVVYNDSDQNQHVGTYNVSVAATGYIVLAGTVAAPDAVTITSTGVVPTGVGPTGVSILQGSGGNILAQSVTLTGQGSIGVSGSAIGLTAQSFSASTMNSGTSTTNGNIYLGEEIPGTAASVVANGAGNTVSVTGSGASLGIGTITAPGGTVTVVEAAGALGTSQNTNITAQTVNLTGKSGIGRIGSPATVTASNLSATEDDTGDGIFVNDTTAASSVSATTNNGEVRINYSGGSLDFTVSLSPPPPTGLLTASGGATVSFDNTGGDDVELGAVNNAASITAAGAITSNGSSVTGGTVTLTAGTGIGAAGNGNAIQTNVTTLDATTTSGDIYINQGANPLTVSATGSDIHVQAAGNLTVGTISAPGMVTLNTGGALSAPNGSAISLTADALDLTAADGIGTSSAVVMTSANTLSNASGGAGGLFLSNSQTLSVTSASASGGAVSITSLGDLDVGSVTATGLAVTLSATGALTGGPGLNVTAQSATLSGTSISGLGGESGDQLETEVSSSITATATGGVLFISDDSTGGSLTLTASTSGAESDIDFTSAESIVLMTVTAPGNTVTLTAAGSITNGNPPNSPVVTITAQTLEISAPGGVGTSSNPLEVSVAKVDLADGGTNGVFMDNAGTLEVTQDALTMPPPGSGTLTFEAQSIIIDAFPAGNTTAFLPAGRSLRLETRGGPIVFLDPIDTIETSNGGTIEVEAGGVAVLGNLTTDGGNITVTADGNITIGQLDAGTGMVTVNSANGLILKGNGPGQPNIIAGSATLSGNAPTARQLQLNEENDIAAAAADEAEAAADEALADSKRAAIPLDKGAVAAHATALTVDLTVAAAALAGEIAAFAADEGLAAAVVAAVAVYDGTQAAALAALAPAAVADAVPLTGDGGTMLIYGGLQITASADLLILLNLQAGANEDEGALDELVFAAGETAAIAVTEGGELALSTAELVVAESELKIAEDDAENANLQSERDAVVRTQSIAANDQGSVIGSPSNPLGIQVSGVVNVSAGPTDSYLQATGSTTVDQINATGSVTLISTGAISDGAPPNTANITATGLTISAANGIGTATQPVATQVPTLNAINTAGGGIDIANTAATPAGLDITGISNTGGGNVAISSHETAPLGQGITVTGPISVTGTGTDNLTINSGSPLAISANIFSAGAVALAAEPDSPPFDNLTVDSGVTIQSGGSSVSLSAGNNIDLPAGSMIEASTTIAITGGKTSANVDVEGTLIASLATIGVDPATNNKNTFTITPSAATPITVTGGTAAGSNVLNINADGAAVTIQGDKITVAGDQPVTFSNFAAVHILNPAGGGSVTLDAAPGMNDFMVLTGTGAGAGTFTLNGGTPISFSGVPSFAYNGGTMTEAITVSPYGTPLQPWGVATTINGGTGTATLTFNDVAGVSDNITIQASAPGAGQLVDSNAGTDVSIAVVTYGQINNLVVNGSSGAGANDTLTVNGTTGGDTFTIAPTTANSATITGAGLTTTATGVGQIAYNGQGGNDALTVTSPAATTVTLTPSAAVDSGTVQMGTAATLVPLGFSNLGTTGTLTVANTGGTRVDTLVYNGTATNDSFTVDAGSGTVHLNNQVSVLTPGVSLLTLNSLAGDNTFTIAAPAPYTTTVINGSGTSDPDVLNLNGNGSAITANLGGTSASTVGGGLGTVLISGVGVVNLNDGGGGAVTISGTSLPDSFNVTPTAANAATVQANGVAPVVNVTAAGLTIGDTNPPDGDKITVNGTAGNDAITVVRGATTTVTVNALLPVAVTTADTPSLLIATGGGTDAVTVSGSAGPAVLSVQGGQSPASDSLTVNNTSASGNTTVTPGATNDAGTVANADGTIQFAGMRSVAVNDNALSTTDTLIVNDANGNSTVTTAHPVSSNLVWVNNQAVVSFSNFNQLTLNARFGNDSINVAPVGMTLVGANPTINVNGTASTTDTLTVFGSAAADTVAYTPGAATPNLAITGAPVVNLGTGITALTYNGQSGNDLLTINTGAGSTTVYNPGNTPDAGSVQVNSLVPLSFTSLGNGGQAVNLAGGAASSLLYNGTAASNVFTATGLTGPTRGQVQLQINGVNQLPIVTTASVTSLTLNGVAGNNTFNVAGGLPYTTTTVAGNAVANLTNPIGNITVNLADSVLNTNTTITGYGGTVTLIGVVTANLSANGNSVLVSGTSLNDNTTYTPTGTNAGTFTNTGLATVFNFTGDTSTFTISGQGNTANQVTVDAPAGRASVREVNRVVTVLPIGSPAPLEPVTLAGDVQIVNLMGGGGPDTFGITPAAGLQYVSDGNLDNLVVNVSNTGGSSALVIESATGGPLAPNQSVVLNHGQTPGNGIARTFTAGVEWPDINYTNMPTVLTNGPAIPGQTGVSASETGTTVTITTPSPNGLQVGYSVMISGFTGPAASYNGTWVITSILSPTMFTYADPVMGLPPATGGTEVPVVASQVDTAGPHINGVAISGQTSAGVNVLSASGSLTPSGQTGLSATALGTTVTITTPTPHGLLAGTGVSVAGFTGNNNAAAPYNGTWVITSVPTPTTFTYTVAVNNLPAATGGIEVPSPGQTGVSASELGTTVTVTTPSAHGLQVGNTVSIGGFTGTKAGYNGTFVVTGVPTPTTFTYTDSVTALPSATAGSEVVINTDVTITTPSAHGLQQGDSVTIGGFTGAAAGYNGTWVVTGSLTPTTFTYTNPATNLPTSATGGSEVPVFSLFALTPQSFTQGPTPLINSLTISVVDPGQVGLDPFADVNPGLYTVVGDQTGIAPVSQVIVTNTPVVTGQPATATVQLFFAQSLLDDRYTLTINKNLVDQAGNQLAGTSNASEPIGPPTFPSGHDGLPADFVARFTVNSRPHIGVDSSTEAGSSQQQLDINGNGFFDPVNAADAVNSDKAFSFGLSNDTVFSGNFAPAGQSGTGYDELAAYGQVNNQWRWLLTFNNVAQPDYSVVSNLQQNWQPVVGRFNPAINADEIGLFDGNGHWYIDFNHTNNVGGSSTVLVSDGLVGTAVVGDFDGSGHIEFATYQASKQLWTFDLTPFATTHTIITLQMGFNDNDEANIPVAADMNGDGVTDIGLYVPPDSDGPTSGNPAGWYWLVSQGTPVVGTINTLAHPFNPSPFSNDLYYTFGSGAQSALIGHWDPPLTNGLAGPTGTPLEVVVNRGQLVAEGGGVTISSTTLRVTDPVHANVPVTYTVTALPTDGELLLSGKPATVGTTFTQRDINLGHLRYQHDGSETVADSFAVTAADSSGGTLAPTTVAIKVTPVNDAPTLNGNGTALTSILEDTRQSAGDLVSAIVGDTITDADSGALVGIAIIGATGGHGTWQYSTNGGTTWSAFGVVSASQALLLPDTDRVRFVPAANFNGLVSLVYRAWDQTSGRAGGKANLSSSASVGGSKAFSAAKATASLTVTPVNDAPTLVANSHPVVRGGQWGTTASALLAAARAHDVDVPTVFGIAVTATTGDGWEYSTDGGTTWLELGVMAASGVRLLDETARLRRAPGSTGPATLTFRAWDGTLGVAGETADLSAADSVGGSTAFSQVSVKAVWKS